MGNNIYSIVGILTAREEDIDDESFFRVAEKSIQFRIINEDKILLCGFTLVKGHFTPLVAKYGHEHRFENWITVNKTDVYDIVIDDINYSMAMFFKMAATKNTVIYNWYYYIDEHDNLVNNNGEGERRTLLLEPPFSEGHS
jgi:hypothetical protein